ncbi:M17 family metallopeptidase [Planctobacterium marinum]|uniref:Peptidase M17 n=1 Tax=Planctobacterium marinum TaxID=1631968 RepID=A0AA48HHK4_9ALTE|nr:peptidase M17 [Planctobacterium marinum]
MAFPKITVIDDLSSALSASAKWDAVIVVAADCNAVSEPAIQAALNAHQQIDARINSEVLLFSNEQVPGKRIIFAPTGQLSRYYDDVRRFFDVANQAAKLAASAGVKQPLVLVDAPDDERFKNAVSAVYLGLTQGLWQPLEARMALDESELEPITEIGLLGSTDSVSAKWLMAAEAGKRVARDLCGTEPERMAPPGFADYCVEALAGSAVKVEVISDQRQLERQYPLLFAVARASEAVERHQARVITMTYEGKGPIEHSLYLAGKGITYDTGGADLKVNGHMAGMSRDKGGAATVAGFMKMLAQLQPEGIKVVAEIGAVRNSIGADAFVADEIITSRAGVRVRIGNTDAEGRLVLSDVLTHLIELAENDDKAEFFSVATLTGHAARAVGPYTALVENGVARTKDSAKMLSAAGDLWADPAEVSRSRREDFDFVRPRTKADDLLSSNNAASAVTARGHQFPMAFLQISSGLDKTSHAYTHVDIAGSGVEGGDWQHGKPTAAGLMMLAGRYL